MMKWKQTLLVAAVSIAMLSGSYWAFYYEVVSGGQNKVAQH
jgi:hypothetical protein